MTTNLKTFCLTALLMLGGQALWAYDFEVDGIYYNILSKTELTVAVTTKSGTGSYVGDVSIPKSVVYSGFSYNVKSVENYAINGEDVGIVTIPSSVCEIGHCPFNGCPPPKKVE